MQVDEDNVPILKGRSLRPKDAATVLVIRRDGPNPRVLMGRRAKGHVFMASKWVFPGGRLHPADFRVAAASELHADTASRLNLTAPAPRARALAAAAVRELFEETGLVLGAPGSGRTKSPEWRDFLATGHLPHLEPLRFVGRAITPPVRPRPAASPAEPRAWPLPASIDCCSALPRRATLLLPGSDALALDSLLPARPSPLEAALMSLFWSWLAVLL